MIVLYLLLFVIAFFAYLQRRHLPFLLCYLGLMTKLFMLDTSEDVIIQGTDLCMFLNFILLPFVYARNRSVFSFKNDKIAKWIYIFMLFYWLELAVTVISGVETFFNSMKVIRLSFMMWAFFIFRTIPLDDFRLFLKIVFIITLLQSLLFFMQLFGIELLAGVTEDDQDKKKDLGVNFWGNIPTFTVLFFFLVLNVNFVQKYKKPLAILFLSMIFMTFTRGLIISIFVSLFYYLFKRVNRKRLLPALLALSLLLMIAIFVIGHKSEGSGGDSASSQITNIIRSSNNLEDIDKGSGTLAFRVAMLMERVFYLIDNPRYLGFGVGTMHEDSPSTLSQFNFRIGTVNEGRALGRCIIESGDITWVPIVLRYGLVGTALHLYILFLVFSQANKRKDALFILAPYYLSEIIYSIDTVFFDSPVKMLILALFFAMLSRANLEQKSLVL